MDPVVYTESVRVESKVFYIDLKHNARGCYVKLSELAPGKPRSILMVPASCLSWFVKLLEYYLQDTTEAPIDKRLCIQSKSFLFSIAENQKGRFLKIMETSGSHPAGNSTVIVPAAGDDGLGWRMLKDSIQRVCAIAKVPQLDEHEEAEVMGGSVAVGPAAAPAQLRLGSTAAGSPMLIVGHARVLFDIVEGDRGQQLHISEVHRQERSVVRIPSAALSLLQDALVRCMVSLRAPATCVDEFVREWHRNCITRQDKYAYLKLMRPAGLAALFREGLTSELLGDMLVVLDACWQSATAGGSQDQGVSSGILAGLAEEAQHVAQTMHALTFAGGFPMLARQMGASSHTAAVSVLEALRTCLLRRQQHQQRQQQHRQQQRRQEQQEQQEQPSPLPAPPSPCSESHQPSSGHAQDGSEAAPASGHSEATPGSGPSSTADASANNSTGGDAGATDCVASGAAPGHSGSRDAVQSHSSHGSTARTHLAGDEQSEGQGGVGEWSADVLWPHLWHVYVVAPRTVARLWWF